MRNLPILASHLSSASVLAKSSLNDFQKSLKRVYKIISSAKFCKTRRIRNRRNLTLSAIIVNYTRNFYKVKSIQLKTDSLCSVTTRFSSYHRVNCCKIEFLRARESTIHKRAIFCVLNSCKKRLEEGNCVGGILGTERKKKVIGCVDVLMGRYSYFRN